MNDAVATARPPEAARVTATEFPVLRPSAATPAKAPPGATLSFREAVMADLQCSSEQYETRVFWLCLFRGRKALAWILWWVWRGYFQQDLDLIRHVGSASDVWELQVLMDNHRFDHPPVGWCRTRLKLRVSGMKLIRLGKKVWR